MTAGDQPRAAPFVGPRPYKIGEQLFGRDREQLDLLDVLIAERIVLLYSPSGAGKTSLVQAALVPALRNEHFTVPAVARVTFERATGISEPVANRYVFAVLLSLEEDQPKEQQIPPADLARMTISDYLGQRWASTAQTGGMVLIIDQFEEVLTIDPTDAPAKKEFFAQLGAALLDPHRWVLCSMREEHVAGLDPYRNLIPTRFASTFRLELLDERQARQAMQEASAQAGVVFTDGAARKLTDDLRRVRVQQPEGMLEEQVGPTVEPTQLQVVCLRLWSRLAPDQTRIEERDVEALGSADTALAAFYAEAVARLGGRERQVRDWIEHELITTQGLRNQILKTEALQGQAVDAQAIALLDESRIVREERRRGIIWLELTHDRLVQPIHSNNAAWRETHLTWFQRHADLWDRQGRPHDLELRGPALRSAERWAHEHDSKLTSSERDFLRDCVRSRRTRITRIISTAAPAFVIFAAVSAYGYYSWLKAQPWASTLDLATGQAHKLTGDFASIGRSPSNLFKTQIDLKSRTVSRWHLIISRDHLHASDMRSLYGTTINARFLRYANEQELRNRDLIVIAGVSAFRFLTIEPYYVPFLQPGVAQSQPLPAETWAVLMDGASKTVVPLIEKDSDYFLGRGEGHSISLTTANGRGSLLRIKRSNESFRLELEPLNESEDDHLFAMFKYEDRTYLAIQIPRGARVDEFLRVDSGTPFSGTEYASTMTFCFGQSSQGDVHKVNGVEMRIVRIESDEQPSCMLGPFQIVVLDRQDGAENEPAQ
jgi:hypothetical protein